jgi:hypothetical protein
MNPEDVDRLADDLESQNLVPDVPLVLGIPSEITVLQEHYETAEEGRARNARIALVTVLIALLLTAANATALGGWLSTSRALERRNRAVADLSDRFREQAEVAANQNRIDICQDKALAQWFDDALSNQELSQGVLGLYYSNCEATDGKSFRG